MHPVTDAEFTALMDGIGFFETFPTLAIAVSGGSDSMALLILAHEWAAARGGKVVAITIDHGLRPEAREEAQQVGQWCRSRAIAHHVIEWNPPALPGSIQAHAREARYALLADWCKSHHIFHLLTRASQGRPGRNAFFPLATWKPANWLIGHERYHNAPRRPLIAPATHIVEVSPGSNP